MKNKIWRSRRITAAALMMFCLLLTGSGSAVLGADGDEQKPMVLQEVERQSDVSEEKLEFRENDGEVSEADCVESDVILEDVEEMSSSGSPETRQEFSLAETADQIGTMEAEAPEMTEIPEITESPTATDTPPLTDSEEKSQIPSYKIWITPQQTQIKAGKELLYTITVENTGNCPLNNICLQSNFSDTSLEGIWEEAEAAETQGKILKLENLEMGIKKEFYFSVQIPEEKSGKINLYLTGNAEYEEKETGESRNMVFAEESSATEVLPLKADFQVTKTADRTTAVPGDKVIFQICIRNTGERTLHSVVTTEKFQLENVPVRFLEAEGVILNKDRTKARIEKIEQGSSAGLLAEVTLPEKLDNQKLINEVIVTTAETGERKVTSKAEIQVYKAVETTTDIQEDILDGGDKINTEQQSKEASTHPKTGDPAKPVQWLIMISGSFLAAVWVRCRMRD